jgi:hypothetical protein
MNMPLPAGSGAPKDLPRDGRDLVLEYVNPVISSRSLSPRTAARKPDGTMNKPSHVEIKRRPMNARPWPIISCNAAIPIEQVPEESCGGAPISQITEVRTLFNSLGFFLFLPVVLVFSETVGTMAVDLAPACKLGFYQAFAVQSPLSRTGDNRPLLLGQALCERSRIASAAFFAAGLSLQSAFVVFNSMISAGEMSG